MAKISIIVPVYNVAQYIEQNATSLFSQTFDDIEYVFVNDCTKDNSIDLLKGVIEKFPQRQSQIKIINHEVNLGLVHARDTGLQNATGEYIINLDSDDWADTNMCEEMYKAAVEKNADIVWTDLMLNYTDGHTAIWRYNCVEDAKECMKRIMSGVMTTYLGNKMIRKTLLDYSRDEMLDNRSYAEDWNVLIKVFAIANKVAYIPQTFVHYRQTDDSMSTYIAGEKRAKQHILNMERAEMFLKKEGLAEKYQREINYGKLHAKRGLLFINAKEWKSQFPESNAYVWSAPMSLYRRVAMWSVAHNQMWIYNIFIGLKRLKNKLK